MPSIGAISRISATEIFIHLNEVEEDVSYLVRYQPILGIHPERYNVERAAVVVGTNLTTHHLVGLHPGLSYIVSVAAENRAGRGHFSANTRVECRLSI